MRPAVLQRETRRGFPVGRSPALLSNSTFPACEARADPVRAPAAPDFPDLDSSSAWPAGSAENCAVGNSWPRLPHNRRSILPTRVRSAAGSAGARRKAGAARSIGLA